MKDTRLINIKPFLTFLALTVVLFATGMATGASRHPVPVTVSAVDMVTKPYGLLDAGLSQAQAISAIKKNWHITPQQEESGIWLDHDCGYAISYNGMTPSVCAVAAFDQYGAKSYSYFFMFPYTPENRPQAVADQSEFSGCLLQEMHDFGLLIGVPDSSDAIYEAVGSYAGHHIDIRLTDDPTVCDNGCFVVSLAVTPEVYNIHDFIVAER